MKKLLCIALSLVMVLSLVACGTNKPIKEEHSNVIEGEIEEGANTQTPSTSTVESPDLGDETESNENVETPPTEEAPKYKYESANFKHIDNNIGMQINEFALGYIILNDKGELYTVYDLSADYKDIVKSSYTFDTIKQKNVNGGWFAVREGYKLHWQGRDDKSFYYNPDYTDLLFELDSGSELLVISIDNNNDLILQQCLLDGTITEYKIQLRAVTPETKDGSVWDYEYKNESLEGKKYYFESIDKVFIWDDNGVKGYRFDVYDQETKIQYCTYMHKWTNEQLNALIDLDNLLVYSAQSLYTRKGDNQNVYKVVDATKKESVAIALPDGYTTEDIDTIHYQKSQEIELLIEMKDGAICYTTQNNKNTLKILDGVNLREGALGELQHIESDCFAILMDDHNIYKLILN